MYVEGNANNRLEELRSKRETARMGGGLKRQEAIRTSGRGTARDRISLLLDEGSFLEVDAFVTHRTDDHNMFLHKNPRRRCGRWPRHHRGATRLLFRSGLQRPRRKHGGNARVEDCENHRHG